MSRNNTARQRARYWASKSAMAMPGVMFEIRSGNSWCRYTFIDGLMHTSSQWRGKLEPYKPWLIDN